MKNLLIIIFLVLVSQTLYGQVITGNNAPSINTGYTYTYDDGTTHVLGGWRIDAGTGTISNATLAGTTYTCTVTWTAAGSGTLAFKDKFTTTITSLNVNICAAAIYTVSGGGSYCSGGSGVTITLSGSQVGVNYQRWVGGIGKDVIAGTGSAISWTNMTAVGTHTIVATHVSSGCSVTMDGEASISQATAPSAFNVGGGGAYCSGGSGVNVTLSGSETGRTYQLRINGTNSGSPVSGTGSSLTWSNQATAGTYTIEATYPTTGCTKTMTGSASVTMNSLPSLYTVGGGGTYCWFGLVVSLSGSEVGVNYTLKVNGAQSGSIMSGTGSQLNWTGRTVAGTYTVDATNASTGCTRTMTGSTTITTGTTPASYNLSGGGSFCSGGSGVSVTLDGSFPHGITYQLKVDGVNVGTAVSGNGSPITWSNLTTGGTYSVTAAGSSCTTEMNGTPVVTVLPLPTAYTITSTTTGICPGTSGVQVMLSPATLQSDITYQLYRNGTYTGTSTSTPEFRFGNQNVVGTYTAVAINNTTSCTANMSGSVVLTMNPTLGAPSASNATFCGSNTITATPGTNANTVNWYAASTGGAPLVTNTTSPVTSTTTTYYITSYSTTTGCESTVARAPVTVTINPIPASPTAPNTTICGPGTMTATPGTNGDNVRWYAASSGGSPIVTNTTSPSTSVTTTYYVTSYKTSTGCETASRTAVTVTVDPVPTITSLGGTALLYGNQTSFTTISSYSYQWKLDNVNIGGATAQNYSATSPGNLTVGTKATSGSPECPSTSAVTITAPLRTQGSTMNYVSSVVIMKEGVTTGTSLYTLDQKDLAQSISYMDGIGRTIQTVGIGQSGTQTDVVAPVAFNKYGMVDTTFLPYTTPSKNGTFQLNAVKNKYNYTTSDQRQFYQMATNVAHDSYPYARTVYRTQPNTRVSEQGAPGASWQPGQHTATTQLTLNTNGLFPNLRYFKPDGTSTGEYPNKTVYMDRAFDENGNAVRTFTNQLGQTVLKLIQEGPSNFLLTYYAYDEFGRLKYQLPPTTPFDASPDMENDAAVQEFIFRYKYDSVGHVVEKKVPGAAVEYFVYDKLGRLVLTQDGNLRASNQWFFVKYDFLDRPVYSGIYTNSVKTSRNAVQNILNVIDYNTEAKFESEAVNATYHGYTNNAFPTTGTTLLTVNYYDHYDFDRNATPDYSYDNAHLSGIPSAANTSTRGLPTGSKQLIVGTTNWLISCVFYDKYDRAVQMIANNHLNLTVSDKTSYLYLDLAGHVDKAKLTHAGAITAVHQQRYTYDQNWRTTGIYHTLNNDAEQQVASYTYNTLGQLIDKKLHGTGGGNFLQSLDYRYTIRGWINSINNASLTNDSGATNDDTGDYFGMEFAYNTVDAALGNTAQYNGNLSAVKWKGVGATTGTTEQRAYKYTYDQADRLKQGQFKMYGTSAWNQELNTLNERMTYDANGNITALSRRQNQRGLSGLTVTSTAQVIDSLIYTYATGNQLSKVEDAGTSAGFTNGLVNGTTEYTYSTTGSLTADKNKGIDSIKYNVLGRVSRVKYTDGRVQTYIYSATGSKLTMKTYSNTGVLQAHTDYVNGFQYENADLVYQPLPEGRIGRTGTTMIAEGVGDCSTTTGFTPRSSTLTSVIQNGETYLKVVTTTGQTAAPGVDMPDLVLVPGKKYVVRVKGYTQDGDTVSPTIVLHNVPTDTWILFSATGPMLPIGAAKEDWMSYEFTAAAGITSTQLRVTYFNTTTAHTYYLNKIEVKAVTDEYQYTIADHQGNTRVVFSSVTGAPKVSTANMESSTNTEFPNYANVFRSNFNLYDHTDFGGPNQTYSNLLNGGNNQQIGVAKSYKVLPGDKVKIEAYAKFSNQTATSSNLTGFAAALLSAFGAAAPVSGEIGTTSSGLNQYGALVAGGNGPPSTGPKAFVNIILFDKNYKFLDIAYEAIDPAAEQIGVSPNVMHDYMMREYTVKEAGYAYLFVSNENPTLVDVYFDDITMTYTPGNVIQYNEYYPFGMRTANSWDRIDDKPMTSMATGLAAKITFDGNANDLSGTGNNGTIAGGTLTTTEGRLNTLSLDGSTNYSQVADNASLDFGANNFSIAIWVKKRANTSSGDNREVIHKWNDAAATSSNEWMLATTSNGSDDKPTFYVAQGSTQTTVSSPDNLAIGTWYHLSVIREGTKVKLYVNGIQKGIIDVGAGAINNTGLNMVIGKALSGGSDPLKFTNAVYDDVYIYNRALTEEELRYLYLDKPELMVNNYLYNGGGEFNSTASWYETASRGYDPVLGRMNGVDPMAAKYSSLTPYNYAFNMPNMVSDPSGADPEGSYDPINFAMWNEVMIQNKALYETQRGGWIHAFHGEFFEKEPLNHYWNAYQNAATGSLSIGDFLSQALESAYGGTWSNGTGGLFTSDEQALAYGMAYNNAYNSWGYTQYGSEAATRFAYTWTRATGEAPLRATVDYHLNRNITADGGSKGSSFSASGTESKTLDALWSIALFGMNPGERPNFNSIVNPASFMFFPAGVGTYAARVNYKETFFQVAKNGKLVDWVTVDIMDIGLKIKTDNDFLLNFKVGFAFDWARYNLYQDFAARGPFNMMSDEAARSKFQFYLAASIKMTFGIFSSVNYWDAFPMPIPITNITTIPYFTPN